VAHDAQRQRPPQSEVRALLADASAFAKATGWRSAVKLEDGLARTVEWWRGRLAAGGVRPGSDFMR
jgi:UDP-glucose 4-epimerase